MKLEEEPPKKVLNLLFLNFYKVKICKGDTKVIQCGRKQYIYIRKAKYGRLSVACSFSPWSCSGTDVLGIVQNKCGLRSQTCDLKASNKIYGNKCHWGEFLRVHYECKGEC